jgi:hypothetical protein
MYRLAKDMLAALYGLPLPRKGSMVTVVFQNESHRDEVRVEVMRGLQSFSFRDRVAFRLRFGVCGARQFSFTRIARALDMKPDEVRALCKAMVEAAAVPIIRRWMEQQD